MSEKIIGKTIAGKYLVEEELRESRLGKIYRGKHQQIDKGVLIKVLSDEFVEDTAMIERFSSEARIVSQISHPNVLNVTDFGTDEDGTVYIIFEDADGKNLQGAIKSEGLFLTEHAVRIAQQIAFALSAAHSKSILHHHLNSRNILLARAANEAEIVKVQGFGSVKFEDVTEIDMDNPPQFIEYFSPEKLSESGEIDERSDIYSLGVILYEMLAGEVPFDGASPAEILEMQETAPPKPLTAFRDDLPEDLEPLVLRALAKNPEMRHQSADELADELSKIAKGFDASETFVASGGAAAAASAGNTKSNLWKTAFVVLAGISILTATFIYATSMKQTEPLTMLQTDENGIPVQPISPATGINEKNLQVITDDSVPEYVGNSNMPTGGIPGYDQGGDGYCAWCGSGPPTGAPTFPTGEVYTIPGDSGSQFMQPLDGYYIIQEVPANSNPNTNANKVVKPTPAPSQADKPPVDTAPKLTPTPSETTPKPTVEKKPNPQQTPPPLKKKSPKKGNTAPASGGKTIKSGQEKDTQ